MAYRDDKQRRNAKKDTVSFIVISVSRH